RRKQIPCRAHPPPRTAPDSSVVFFSRSPRSPAILSATGPFLLSESIVIGFLAHPDDCSQPTTQATPAPGPASKAVVAHRQEIPFLSVGAPGAQRSSSTRRHGRRVETHCAQVHSGH